MNTGPLILPDLRALLDSERGTTLGRINCCKVGVVQSLNAGKQSVTVAMVVQRVVFNTAQEGSAIPSQPTIVPYPILVDVPAFVLSGGTAYLAMPIAAGDPCLVLFCDHDLDPWFDKGTLNAVPNSPRQHSLADGICLVGIRPANDPVPGIPTDGQHMSMGNQSGTLAAAIGLLFTALLNWKNSDSTTPNPATVTALQVAKTAFNNLFQ